MNLSKWVALSVVWAAGVITIVGSSLEEDRPPPAPPVPVTVQFEINANDLERKIDTRTDEIRDLTLTGSYGANQGDRLTLDRDSLLLNGDVNNFQIEITPVDGTDELLTGTSDIEISDNFDAGPTGNPDTGRFVSVLNGTTTTVEVIANGVDILVEDGVTTDPVFYSWSDFEAAENNENENLDIRMASAAYSVIRTVLAAARLTEDIIGLIEDNQTVLEGMYQSAFSLTCDNATAANSVFDLTWSLDLPGSGQGEIGTGDEFDVVYTNCRDDDFDFYLQGDLTLENYDPAADAGSGTLGVDSDLDQVYLADAPIDGTPELSPSSPRWDGVVTLSLAEQ